VSTIFERPPDDTEAFALLTSGGLDSSTITTHVHTLDMLPLGAHLIIRCRKDWRTATVVRVGLDKITLCVSSPTGRTYRLRRPPDVPLAFDGAIPLLGESISSWRAGLARYDVRW